MVCIVSDMVKMISQGFSGLSLYAIISSLKVILCEKVVNCLPEERVALSKQFCDLAFVAESGEEKFTFIRDELRDWQSSRKRCVESVLAC